MKDSEGGRVGGGGWRAPSSCWWPIYHISALQCFGSHEGGSLNCPKTAAGWRLFPSLSAGDKTHVLFQDAVGSNSLISRYEFPN